MSSPSTRDASTWSWAHKNTMREQDVIDSYTLHILPDYFIIQPMVRDAKECLGIDRINQEIKVFHTWPNVDQAKHQPIHGIVGIINLIAGPYLIVITSRTRVGDINGQTIYKVQTTEVIPYARNMSHLNEHQLKYNTKYVSMIELVLKTESFYFSYTYDISHTFQRLQMSPSNFYSMPMIERADHRFVWNRYLLGQLLSVHDASRFVLPLIHGFIALNNLNLNGHSLTYGLISRRSIYRAGTRLFIRGIDDEGRVANFIETEQILQLADISCSYVQIRGSVPCYWTQLPNLRYKPKVTVLPSMNHMNAFLLHCKEQEFYYGKQFLISLTNHHGAEGRLNEKYRELAQTNRNAFFKFEDFDFHHECAGMRYDRLTILVARVMSDQDDLGYFALRQDGSVERQQIGVFRTNCIDCLDRTNVVQSLFAKRILEKQLQNYNILQSDDTIDRHRQISNVFKNIWADNADIISLQYAGTGALKNDYTRNGQRSTMGLVRDGYNSCVRYFLNNFFDGFRQDGIDLFLGNYRVTEDEGRTPESCPISKELSKKFLALPVTMFLAFSMCIINLLIPAASFREQMTYVLFWGAATISTLAITLFWGRELVDTPRLYAKTKRD